VLYDVCVFVSFSLHLSVCYVSLWLIPRTIVAFTNWRIHSMVCMYVCTYVRMYVYVCVSLHYYRHHKRIRFGTVFFKVLISDYSYTLTFLFSVTMFMVTVAGLTVSWNINLSRLEKLIPTSDTVTTKPRVRKSSFRRMIPITCLNRNLRIQQARLTTLHQQMGGNCSMHGRDEKSLQYFNLKT